MERYSAFRYSILRVGLVAGFALLASAGCALDDVDDAPISWDEFKTSHTQVVDGRSIYIVEWDIAVTLDELREYYEAHIVSGDVGSAQRESIVNTVGGVDDVWTVAQKQNLTYCVTDDFGAAKARAVSEMDQATKAWEAVTDVNFTYVPAHDANCGNWNASVVFAVRPWTGGGACAFFPSGGGCVPRTVVMNFASFDGTPSAYTTVGVFRHELGHVLGLRHEHTRPETGVCYEDSNWRATTEYDVNSVMHYPWCNGNASSDLSITGLDSRGVRRLYGAPNLLTNGDGSAGNLSGWTMLQNGGNGMVVSGGAFRTSYGWARREQLIDLYAHGYDAQSMADAPPVFVAEEFKRIYCPDQYQLTVQLLDDSMNVVAGFDTGVVTQTGPCDYAAAWEQVEHVFTGYGPNVRYVRWQDAGRDTEWWAGHFGVAMDDAVLRIGDNLITNPGAESGSMAGWTITQNSGNGWLASGGAFRTSYGWAGRTQLVDLFAHGYSATQLADAPPIFVSERFMRIYCPDRYQLAVELLDASMNVVSAFNTGVVTQTGPCDYAAPWETVSHTFTGYGANVRYVRFSDGGQDTEFWWGHYGVALDDAVVSVQR